MERYRTRRAGWRALTLLVLLLAAAAVFWHREWAPPPVRTVVPPYTTPAVAGRLLTHSDLPARQGEVWLNTQNGPPETALFTGTGRLRADVRELTVVGAWQRTWESADGLTSVAVRGFEMRRSAGARTQGDTSCSPSKPFAAPGADRAGFFGDPGPDYASGCAVFVRGRTAVAVFASTSRAAGAVPAPAKAVPATEQLITELVRAQRPRITPLPDLPARQWRESTTRTALNAEAMSVALGLPLAVGVLILVLDPASWRRPRSLFSRSRADGVFRVDRLVRLRLARTTAAVAVRFCVYAWTLRLTERLSLGVWATVAVALSAVACVLMVEWLLRGRHPDRWRPAVFRGWGRLLALLGLAATAAVAVVGLLMLVLGSDLQAMGVSPASSDYVATGLGTVVRAAGVALLLLALLPFTVMRRLGMRALRRQAEQDPRPPTLMLRSFADDRRVLRARRLDRASVVERLCMRRFERFEEVAASALAVHGPVETLGQVGEKLPPPLGAARRNFSMDEWKDGVRDLIARSRLICVTVGRSESLLWEIEEIRQAGALGRTLFVLPPTGRREQRLRLAVLARALRVDWSVLDRSRPGTEVLAVTLPFGSPVVIVGQAPNDVAYETAVEIAALAVTGPERAHGADLRHTVDAYVSSARDPAPAGRPATRPGRTAPRVEIHRPGRAPEYRLWWRRPWLVIWLAGGLVTATVTTVFGDAFENSETVRYGAAVTSVVQDQASDATYAVVGGRALVRLNFDRPGEPGEGALVTFDDYVDDLVVRDAAAYYVSTVSGQVGRVDLRTGHTVWKRSAGGGPRTLALVGDSVVVPSPAAGRVDSLSAGEGRLLARRTLAGTPYGITAHGGHIFVGLAAGHQVVELSADGLRTLARLDAPRNPLQLTTSGGQVWARSGVDHVLEVVGPGADAPAGHRLLLSDQSPRLSGNGRWLAVQGMERVTVIKPDGTPRRLPLPDTSFLSLVVERNGAVIVGFATGQVTRYP
ncbi:PQQ-binding-like beta-propeller repeat protein [Streptomyces liangshanensis]|uniref:PQQ-binding-like beta-propeller repeat protein n=1 Tax=Streptomyces liangshanensis TaxID=2717324 RepID=A0A6G9H7T9_9ACTN|nr:PQQ-binding-like beta-propeller repeat protein [Streptomyces liangshanensis]QIQ06167.1 PQQ-binding-like beta-propeller repeat protein [Streptomyces liangshanensis]